MKLSYKLIFIFVLLVLVSSSNAYAQNNNPFVKGQVWNGWYDCGEGKTKLKLTILKASNRKSSIHNIEAIYDFTTLKGVNGAFNTTGHYRTRNKVAIFEPNSWVKKPEGYVTVNFKGIVSADGNEFIGKVLWYGCSDFKLYAPTSTYIKNNKKHGKSKKQTSHKSTLIKIERSSKEEIAEHERILKLFSNTQISGKKFLTQKNLDIANFIIQTNKLTTAINIDGYNSSDGIQQVLDLVKNADILFEESYQYKPSTLIEFYDHKVFKQEQAIAISRALYFLGKALKNNPQFYNEAKALNQKNESIKRTEKKYTSLWDKKTRPSDNEIIGYMEKVAWDPNKVEQIASKFYRKKSVGSYDKSEKIQQAINKLYSEKDAYWSALPEEHPFKKRVNTVVKKIKATLDTNEKIKLAKSLGYNHYDVTDYWNGLPKPLRIALGKEREVHIYSSYEFICNKKVDCKNYFLSFIVKTSSLADGKLESKEITKFTTNFHGDIYVNPAPINHKENIRSWISGFTGNGRPSKDNSKIIFNTSAYNTPYGVVNLNKKGIVVTTMVALPKKLLGKWELQGTF